MPELRPILLVEDSPKDLELTMAALEKCQLANDIVVARDGEEALDYLYGRGIHANRGEGDPTVVLLDLKLPKIDGLEVLKRVKGDADLMHVPVVMLTSSREEQDLVSSYQLGVNAFVVKPVEFSEFFKAIQDLGVFWAILNEPPQGSAANDRKIPHILVLEDSTFDAELIEEHVRRLRPEPKITRAVCRAEYVSALDSVPYDVILSDYSLPDFDGLAALNLAREKAPETPFIFVSGVLGEEIAIESFRMGATDYVLKQRLIRLPSAVERALAETRERAERLRAEQQRELLLRELSHRVKNTMAVMMAIVRRTARTSETVGDYEEALVSRLHSMSEAHALLFEANWGETELDSILRRIVEPYHRGDSLPFAISGGQVKLEPKAALALGMVFHELVTNAAKYGALSSPGGKVDVSWSAAKKDGAGRVVRFVWSESGGPEVVPPAESGFGTTLIERSIRYELDGGVGFFYEPKGFRCEVTFPL